MEADEARPICDGRRVGAGIPTTSPPIYLYHPIFGRFIHMVEDPDVQPTVEDLKNVAELMYYLSLISTSELAYEYAEGLHQRLHILLRGDVLPRINSDGTISVGGAWIQILILELQREMGEDGPGPTHQASLRMKRSWISPSASHNPLYIDFMADCLIEPNDPQELLLPNISNQWSWALAGRFRRRIHRQDYCSTLD